MPSTDTAAIDNLRALAVQADATGDPGGFEMPDETSSDPSPDPAPAPEPKPPEEGSDQPPAPEEPVSPDKSAEAATDKPEPLSKYQKAQQRQSEAWKRIEAEKAAVKAEREALEKERQKPEPVRDQRQYTAADYADAAKRAEEEGEPEIAKQLRGEEQKLRMEEHKRDWWTAFKEESGEHKLFDALKDPAAKTPEVEQFTAILNAHNGLLRTHPMGAKIAVRLLAAEQKAATASALKTENERLIKDNERLTKATSLPRTGPSRVGSESSTPKELTENDLRRMADEHDQSMVA